MSIGTADTQAGTCVMKAFYCPITKKLIQEPVFSPNDGAYSHFLTQFREVEHLGSGNFGCAVMCVSLADKREYAVKKVEIGKLGKLSDINKAQREMDIWAGLSHVNIVRYHSGWFESTLNGMGGYDEDGMLPCMYIQMELCDGQTLYDMLQGAKKLQWNKLWTIFNDILEGLQYIHRKGYIHGDLRPSNIFFHQNVSKIGDFGEVDYLSSGSGGGKVFTDMFEAGFILNQLLQHAEEDAPVEEARGIAMKLMSNKTLTASAAISMISKLKNK